MIEHKDPLSISESTGYIKNKELLNGFIKKFVKTKPEKAKELRGKIEDLNFMKLNSRNISKIIDFLPEDKEDLNKVLTDVSLDENETNTILQTIKEFI